MSAIAIAVGSTVVGLYGASKASSAAKSSAAAQREAAERMESLGQDELAFAKRQYEEALPIRNQIVASQLAAQDEQTRQAQNYFAYQQQTFRPVEQGLVRDAERFSTEGYREQMAGQAAAAAGRAFGVQQDMGQRAMASRGVNPNSGAGMALQAQGNLGLAAQRANAMTGARTQAEQLGFARRLDVTGLGRGLAGASTAAYGGATSAGSAAMGNQMAPGTQYGQLSSGARGIASTLYTGANQAAMGAQGNYMGLLGGLVGMGGTVAAAKFGQR
jgi:hypothetical protein